ncbi:MAG TPA: MurR/RpiR family transcriptional regulator [Candidatus Competibacteraceae bacterium]|nr:MurR/RpiR family transcriptional regulator [Candidatus Competibacteraceae bacterium]
MSTKHTRSIAEELRRSFDRLTPTERKPARVLLANYPVAGLETVAQFAARAEVSGPTILRLIGKLGFSSYPEFQQALREELTARLQSPLAKTPGAGAGGDLLERMAEAVCDNIRVTLADLPRAEFDAVVALLADPRRTIYLLGGRFGQALAEYFRAHLRVLRKGVQVISGQPATWPETLLDLSPKDVLVVFDVRRYQTDVITFAERAAARGTQIVLFTDQWLSPISKVAAHTLPVHITVPSRWDSAVATLTLIECLIATITERHWPQARSRIEQLEALRQTPDGAPLELP